MDCAKCVWYLECQNVNYQNEPCRYYEEAIE